MTIGTLDDSAINRPTPGKNLIVYTELGFKLFVKYLICNHSQKLIVTYPILSGKYFLFHSHGLKVRDQISII